MSGDGGKEPGLSDSVTFTGGLFRQLAVESSRGTASLDAETNADIILVPAVSALFERIANPNLAIHRLNISVNHVIEEEYRQYSMFTDVQELERNRKLQTAMLDIKKKFGKNAILKGINLQEASTMQERNQQIGGHKSGFIGMAGTKAKSAAKSVKAQNTKPEGREMAGRPGGKDVCSGQGKNDSSRLQPFKGLPEALAEKRAGSGAQNHSDRDMSEELNRKMQQIEPGMIIGVVYFKRRIPEGDRDGCPVQYQ